MDPAREADRRVEQARASLLAHVGELGRRIQEAKAKLDIRAKIIAHPRAAAAIAFTLGALAGIPGKRKPAPSDESAKNGLLGVLVATMGSLAFTLAKNVAMHQLSRNASDWWDRRSGIDADASHARDVESFLGH